MRYSLAQIQAFVAIARSDFNVSRAATKLNTSQSAISKHLKYFEQSLGAKVFTRAGKRLTGLTAEGDDTLHYAERMLRDRDSIENIGRDAVAGTRQTLSVSTTPTLARYLLADAVVDFASRHPDVQLHVQVEESDKAVEVVRHGNCDLAVVPIGKATRTDLSIEMLTRWTRLLIGLPDGPLFSRRQLTLDAIAAEPIIAFQTSTVSLKDTFDQHGLHPDYALTTSNPEVMKAYAALGLGVAVVATPTFDPVRDAPLVARDVSALFPSVAIAIVRPPDSYRSRQQRRFLAYLRASLPTGTDG